jgi:hypothetical protein
MQFVVRAELQTQLVSKSRTLNNTISPSRVSHSVGFLLSDRIHGMFKFDIFYGNPCVCIGNTIIKQKKFALEHIAHPAFDRLSKFKNQNQAHQLYKMY